MKNKLIFLFFFICYLLLSKPVFANLALVNNSFEITQNNQPANWYFWNPSGGTLTVDSNIKYHGDRSVKIRLGSTILSGYSAPISCINQGGSNNNSFGDPNNFIDKKIAFSFWYRHQSQGANLIFKVNLKKNDGTRQTWWHPAGVLEGLSSTNNQWKNVHKLISFTQDKLPSGVNLNQIIAMEIDFCFSGPANSEVWIDHVLLFLPKHYSAIVIGEKPLATDYSYSDGERSMAFLNKGHSKESASTKIFLPRVLKGAYKKPMPAGNPQDQGFNSGIVVMNTENKQINISLKIYTKEGDRILKEYSRILPPYGFTSFWPPSLDDWPTNPADPPAVIEASGGKIVVDVDLRNQSDPAIPGSRRGAAYEGIPLERTSKTWYVPKILRNAYKEGWESGLVIQNTKNSQASIAISLYGLDNNYQKTCSNVTVPANGQKIIYFPVDNDCFPELINNSNYNNDKKFSAKIFSDQEIAVVVAHTSLDKRKSIEENAIPAGLAGEKIFVPRVYNNYYGWISSFTIQNTSSSSDCSFSVKYIKDNGIISTGNNDCYQQTISPLKSVIIYPPNIGGGYSCISEGNVFYSAQIEKTTGNCQLAAFYHLAYPKNQTSETFINRAAGATAFSEKEISKVFFIPRIYFYSWNWQTGLQIQNAVDENNNFNLYILNDQGKIIARRNNVSLLKYQAKSYYIPDVFAEDLAIEPPAGGYPSIPSDELTPTPTPTNTPTNTPLPTPTNVANCLCETNSQCSSVCPVNQESNYWERAGSNNITYTKPMKCSLSANYYITSPNQDNKNSFCNRSKRPKGDVNGDGKVDFLGDYLNYIQVFVGGKIGPENNPDVNGDGQVTPEDGVIIRGNLPQ